MASSDSAHVAAEVAAAAKAACGAAGEAVDGPAGMQAALWLCAMLPMFVFLLRLHRQPAAPS